MRLSLVSFSVLALSLLMGSAASAQTREKITVYSAGPANLIERLAAGFKRDTGIDVGVFQGTTGEVMARVEAESANPAADVLISASWDTAQDFTRRGLLLPYTSANSAKVPDFLKSDTAVTQGISALAIVWNPKSGTPRPADWSDLAKPDYKGLVTIPDPALSGASFELVAALMAADGGKLFEALKANGAVVAGANAQALNPVLQGAKAAVFGAVDYIALDQRAKGEGLEIIFPTSGTIVAPRPAMIFKSSKHADAARKFIDYLTSDAGQAEVAKVFLMPARTDIKADRLLIADLKLLKSDTPSAYARRDEILTQFRKIMGR